MAAACRTSNRTCQNTNTQDKYRHKQVGFFPQVVKLSERVLNTTSRLHTEQSYLVFRCHTQERWYSTWDMFEISNVFFGWLSNRGIGRKRLLENLMQFFDIHFEQYRGLTQKMQSSNKKTPRLLARWSVCSVKDSSSSFPTETLLCQWKRHVSFLSPQNQ